MQDLNTIIERFKEKGLKVTPQRMAIIKSLDGDKTHPSVMNIYRRLKNDFPTMSLATVYNTLDTLMDLREVVELRLAKDRSNFDPDTSPHDHILCISCNRIDDIHRDSQNDMEILSSIVPGYKVLSSRTQYYGICGECRRNQ